MSQLNRNIETRNEKQPLLSDLKESGCIDSKNNIALSNLLNNCINLINLKTVCKNLIKTNHISNKQYPTIQLKSTLQNSKQIIYVSSKYIFESRTKTKMLSLTQNHKYLSQDNWIQTNQILEFTKINNINKKYSQQLEKKQTINIIYINHIFYHKYSKSYDISINNYFNFFSKEIVLHNSIEQDADIVMMLYKNNENIQIKNKKVLDLTICKNRNGPTGSCKLLFVPHITLFENINNKNIEEISLIET